MRETQEGTSFQLIQKEGLSQGSPLPTSLLRVPGEIYLIYPAKTVPHWVKQVKINCTRERKKRMKMTLLLVVKALTSLVRMSASI